MNQGHVSARRKSHLSGTRRKYAARDLSLRTNIVLRAPVGDTQLYSRTVCEVPLAVPRKERSPL